jgi:hypothetical protein
MIKRKSLFGLVAAAGVAVTAGVAYAAVSLASNTAQASPEAAVDLANIETNPANAVFLEADLSGHGEWQRYGKWAGDPNGKAVLILRITRNQIMFEVTMTNMSSASWINMGQGAFGTSGPLAMNLMTAPMPSAITSVVGVVNLRNNGLLGRLLGNPGNFYANIGTPSYGHGAVRGQFRRIGPVDFNQILHVGPWASVDSGDQEVQTAGDMNGHANVFIGAAKTNITFAAIWNGVWSPTALTVNRGAIGNVGNIVTTLFRAPRGLDPTIIAVAGVVTNVPANAIAAMAAAPGQFHTDLLTGRFPNGAVRGQLFSTMTMTTTPPTTTTTMPMPTTTKPVVSAPPTTSQSMTNPPANPAPTTTGQITHW